MLVTGLYVVDSFAGDSAMCDVVLTIAVFFFCSTTLLAGCFRCTPSRAAICFGCIGCWDDPNGPVQHCTACIDCSRRFHCRRWLRSCWYGWWGATLVIPPEDETVKDMKSLVGYRLFALYNYLYVVFSMTELHLYLMSLVVSQSILAAAFTTLSLEGQVPE
jgi:hypothetical protein